MRLPSTARVGIYSLAAGILISASTFWWVSTRTLTPLDIPVSLAPGHIRTGDFKINIEANFSVQVYFPWNRREDCQTAESLHTRRLTSLGGQPILDRVNPFDSDPGVTHGTDLGTFHLKPGRYHLGLEVLSPTQHFDQCNPRLLIQATPEDFGKWDDLLAVAFYFSDFCVFAGISALLVYFTTYFRKDSFEVLRLRIFPADPFAPQFAPPPSRPERRFPLRLILGIFLISAAVVIFAATKHWYDSRDFVLVDMPVSLSKGHIRTGTFSTNLNGSYFIEFETSGSYLPNCSEYSVLKSKWVVKSNGKVFAHREHDEYDYEPPDAPIEGTSLHSFGVVPGTYNLDIEILSDASCLNAGNPRLFVSLSGFDRDSYDDLSARLQWLSLFLFGLGCALLIAYRFTRLRIRPSPLPLQISLPQQPSAWGITGLRLRPRTTHSAWSTSPNANLPTFALACSLTWLACFVSVRISIYPWSLSKGLPVSVPRRGVPPVALAPGLTAPLVSIDAKERVYLNYQRTTWEKLPAGLDRALRVLPDRVVYVEGDAAIPFNDVARAIDIIRGSSARAILIAPSFQSEYRESSSPAIPERPRKSVSPSRRSPPF